MLGSSLKVNRRFRGTSPSSSGSKNKPFKKTATKLVARGDGFLLYLFFDLENGRDILLRNVGLLSADYTELYPRRQYSASVTFVGLIIAS
jgi:hypothetical protein